MRYFWMSSQRSQVFSRVFPTIRYAAWGYEILLQSNFLQADAQPEFLLALLCNSSEG